MMPTQLWKKIQRKIWMRNSAHCKRKYFIMRGMAIGCGLCWLLGIVVIILFFRGANRKPPDSGGGGGAP